MVQQQEHKMRRIDLSPYAEQEYQVRIAFWYLDTPERQRAEAFLIHTLHPRHNIDYPGLRGPWNLQTPDDEDIDPETVRTGTRTPGFKAAGSTTARGFTSGMSASNDRGFSQKRRTDSFTSEHNGSKRVATHVGDGAKRRSWSGLQRRREK